MPRARIDLNRFISEHVKYEIDMLRATHARLTEQKSDWTVQNALIESFWVHARNLLEFFGKQKHAYPIDTFCKIGYVPFDFSSIGVLYGKICAQITHLQAGRAHNEIERLDPVESETKETIENEIERFRGYLKDEYTGLLPPCVKPRVGDASVSFSGPNRTTTSVTL